MNFESRVINRQDNNGPFETILAEVAVEGEGSVDFVMVDQCKARAIDKTEISENHFGSLFNRSADMKHPDTGLVKKVHELGSRLMTDSEPDQSIRFREDEVGC
jgi:hypothetical protein